MTAEGDAAGEPARAGAPAAAPAAVVVGASSGVGAACLPRLAAAGFRVVAAARRDGEAAARLAGLAGCHAARRVDVTDPESVAALAAWLVAEGRVPRVLVYAVGVGCFAPLEEHDAATWDRVFRTNVRGAFEVLARLGPHLERGSRIVLVSSTAARAPFEGGAAYCASKAALDALARVARLELAPRGILVSVVAPGTIDTPFWPRPRADADVILTAGAVADAVCFLAAQPEHAIVTDLVLQPEKEL
ncbi:MAG TPA: SDR family oxidoreductase [Longimicrobium sp.]